MEISNLEAWLWATPNSRRVSILFDELDLACAVHPINIRAREQFAPEILALNPYGKLPIVRWTEAGQTRLLVESGAILLHFGASSPALLPTAADRRAEVLQWLMFAMTSLGPMTGQAHHWTELAPEKSPIAEAHSLALVGRAYRELDRRLAATGHYLAGDYSLADIAAYPWVAVHDWARIRREDFPSVSRWLDRVGERPAVRSGMAVPRGARLE